VVYTCRIAVETHKCRIALEIIFEAESSRGRYMYDRTRSHFGC